MILNCTCHGSSCANKTCWEELPLFKTIALKLREKFYDALRVRPNYNMTKLSAYRKGRQPSSSDLVFSRYSPSFCEANPKLGIPGTRDRQCAVHSAGVGGCDVMCCGRGYKTIRRFVPVKCSATKRPCRKAKLDHRCL